MNPKILFFLIFLILPVLSGEESQEINITVYRDGYCHVSQILNVEENTIVTVPVFGENLENILITGDRNILYYDISGKEITVDTEENTEINIEYDTPDLTSKEGILWTLSVNSPSEFTVIFPEGATVVDLSSVPLEISGNMIKMPEGYQKLSYFFTSETKKQINFIFPLIALFLALLFLGTYILWNKKRKFSDLAEEEKRVIEFLERNGDSLSSEIRKNLGIPKTTAWRLFRRMEEKGVIEIKKGKENYIKLKKL
ncbi:MAG TPA: winged helix-turn-helix transcriptional regulator [Methanomicrobia archaeon]|nr:winged helix-turn-helix transcriptional regulator [Methanomicrobia archaeon]